MKARDPHTARLAPVVLAAVLLAAAQAPAALLAAEGSLETVEVPVGGWLLLGPAPLPLPAFHGEEGVSGEPFTVRSLLGTDLLDPLRVWPAEGDTVTWSGGDALTWASTETPVALEPGPAGRPGAAEVAFLAAYLEAGRFLEAKLTVSTPHRARVLLDGEPVAEKTEGDPATGEGEAAAAGSGKGRKAKRRNRAEGSAPAGPGSATAELALAPGKHLLLVEALWDPAGPPGWTMAAKLELPADQAGALTAGTSPRRGLGVADLLDVDAVTGLSVSAEGDLVALELRHPALASEDGESWVEIRRASDGSPLRVFRGAPEVSAFTWGPGHRYSYVTRDGETATLWVGDLETGELRPLLRDIENLGSHRWSPDGSYLVYAVSEEPEAGDTGVERRRGLQDRWAGWRSRESLDQVSVPGGTRRRLTAGERSVSLEDIHPDGSRLLFSRTRYTRERPFSVGELWELPLGEGPLEPEHLADVTWLAAARYSPDGESLLVTAGPSGFGDLGVAVPEGHIPNEYDSQLYLLRRSGEVEPLTRDFDPAVRAAAWSRHDGHVYLAAEDGSRVRLYRLSVDDRRFEALATGVEVVEELDLAAAGPTLVYLGSSVTEPPRVMALDITSGGAPRTLLEPGHERLAQVEFGRVEEWSFEAGEDGAERTRITGRVHYPPDFDPERSWPLLVYYYGGTAPIDRAFGGRYPKNLWTSRGYVVLIVQPSGATGFGQAFSSLHVNDWGRVVAGEILQGVETFLAEHPFVDRDRVGCLGGSYGGFMTMLLLTRTDLFSAAVSHAGISSIASYWGEGWWGYLYSAVAGAGSYPWNRRDLYVGQSPLFAAEKIETPLLLLHGTADPNVPPGESEQMYTALELLGKKVELVTFEGEQHLILDYDKRKLWWEAILAWFDRHLKGQPEAWEHLWKGK